ncbi:hypothetical protein L7F22_046025 [Adiantum nelumboides]|nr:hypothetical protein [Adiantum nelumboides]
MRELKEPGTSYDGPEKAKKIDLAEPGEEPKLAYIATDPTEEEEQLLIATLKQYKDVFAWSYKDLKGVDPSICQHTIPLKSDAKPSRQRPYTYNETFARKIKEEIDKLKEAEFIYEIEHTDWVSPIVVVPKKNKKLKVCVNLKKVNAATIRDKYPLPITDHVIERVAGREAYSFLDGFSRYNQLAIKAKDQHKTAFATEWGIFAYRVMPFGLTNAPATFQRLMSHAFKKYLRQFLEIYMDDLCVHSLIRMDHIENLTKIFKKCRLYRICLNLEKYVFMVKQGKILGHIVSKNGISMDMEKIFVIVELPRPLMVKEVQAFMGHCGYYRRFIYLYDIIAKPLYALITKFEWTDECEKAFQILKQRLISAPILKAPDWDKIFHVHVDASAFAIGCILAQLGEKNMDFPISYSSRQLNSAEKNYTTTKRKGLGIIYAVKKFRHYLLSNKFVFFVDHQALLYLVNKPCSIGRIVRWFIILLEFDFTVVVKKGTTHQRADHLSRLTHGEAPIGIDDDLPDAYLFNIDMVPRWSEEVIPLLTIGSLYLTKQPSIIGASRSLVMLAGMLYKQGSNQILRLCIEVHEQELYLNQSHVQITGIHNGHAQTYQRMPRQKTVRQWDRAPYEADELSTNEKSHIPDEVLAQIPAHIFIAKFRDEEGGSAEITKDIINEALQFIPGAYNLIPKTKSIDNEKAFLKVKGIKFKYSDLIYSELELPLRLISQHLRVQKPPRYTEPFLHMAVVMALCVAERRQVRCDYVKNILESLIEANLKNSAKNKLYMNAGPMFTRIAYQALGMIEDLPAASSQASLIQQAKYIPKAVKTTSSAASSRSTRSKKSSSEEERIETDKEQGSQESAQEDVPKEAETIVPSEYKSDEEGTSVPLERKSQKPRSREQVLMDEAMARVEARRKELAEARAAKAAGKTRPMTMEEARKIRIERAKALQKERRRIEAKQKTQEEPEAAKAAQTQEREVIDLSGTVEYLKKVEREKHTAEQRAAQLAREKIKEALSKKAEEPVLEPTQGSPKRPRQKEEEEIEHIQADPTPPSPINIPPAPPSSPITPFPLASTPQTPHSPLPLEMPKSPPAPTSPQQQHLSAESSEIPASLTEEIAQPMETQTSLQKETAQPMETTKETKETNGGQQQPTESQLIRKEAWNHELIKNKKKMKEQLKYKDARFQKLTASYNTIKNTLTALLQNQEPAAAAPSTSDSAALNTLAALQEELQTKKLRRQLLVSRFMSQTALHEAKVKQLKEELARAKAELEAVGSLASTSQIHQAETHVPI